MHTLAFVFMMLLPVADMIRDTQSQCMDSDAGTGISSAHGALQVKPSDRLEGVWLCEYGEYELRVVEEHLSFSQFYNDSDDGWSRELTGLLSPITHEDGDWYQGEVFMFCKSSGLVRLKLKDGQVISEFTKNGWKWEPPVTAKRQDPAKITARARAGKAIGWLKGRYEAGKEVWKELNAPLPPDAYWEPEDINRVAGERYHFENIEREKRKAKNGLESYCFVLEKTLRDEKLKDKFEGEGKTNMESAVQDTLFWLVENPLAEKDVFKAKRQELEGIVNPILMKVYQGGMPE